MNQHIRVLSAFAALLSVAASADPADSSARISHLTYGTPITLEQAKVVAAGARAEAEKRGLSPTIAVVEPSGALVYYERGDRSTIAAEDLALKKAKGAARYGHGGDEWMREIDAKKLAPLVLPGPIFPYHGSDVIVVKGLMVGAVGVTGGADSEVAKAGADAIK